MVNARPFIYSLPTSLMLSFPVTALAQVTTPSATTSVDTKGGLPEAGNITPTVIIVTLAVILIIVGLTKFFKSFR